MDSARITRLGHHGDGILETGAFVPFTLPGERVGVEQPHPVLEFSENRATPLCPQFGTCGGCALQHGSDAFVAGWKREVVLRALAAQGVEADIGAVHTSPPQSRRRAHFAARRTKKGVQIGFHARRSDQIVPVEGCVVLRPALLSLLPNLAPLVRASASRKGVLRIQVTESMAGLDLHVTEGKPLDRALRETLGVEASRLGLARLTWGDDLIAMERPPAQRMGGADVVPPPGAFLQATVEGEAALVAGVERALQAVEGPVVDLFAGCGTFTLPLAAEREVHAVEGEAGMLAALDAGWRHAAGLQKVSTEARDLFRRPLLAPELARFAGAVIDPPRAGAEAQVAALAASNIGRIAMVSCNPVTFARDAATLKSAGFSIDWIEVVDQFRWSPHIEMVAALKR